MRAMANSFTRSVALNTIVQLLGKVVTTVLALVLIAALTRYLGVSSFGAYTTVFAYVAFLGVLADFGFFWIMVREIARTDERKRFDAIVSNVLTLRTFLGIAIFALGSLVAWFIPQYSYEVRAGIVVISIAWLGTALNSTFVGVFQNKLRMDKAVLTDIAGRTITLGLTLWFILRGGDLATILWAYVAGTWLNLILSFLVGRAYVTVRPRFEFGEWKRIFWEAFPMGVVLVFHVIYFRIDSVMLSLMKGTTDVGIYGAPYKILDVLLTLPVMFLGNVFPMLARLLAEKSDRIPGIIQRSFDALLTIALPLTVGGMLLAAPIVRVVAGDAFVNATTLPPVFGQPATAVLVLQILMVTAGLGFLSNLGNYIMIALGKQRQLIWPFASFIFVNVILNFVLIPHFSYIGSAFATGATELVVAVYLGILALKATKVRIHLGIAWRIVLATTVMGLFLAYAPLPFAAKLVGGVVVYLVAAWATGVISPDLIRELTSFRKSA